MPTTSPLQIEQRSAGVAGIHRNVGLDERRVVGFARHRARRGADDTGGDAVLEAERRTNGDNPFARLELRGVAEAHRRQILRLDLDHGHVGAFIDTDDLGCVLAPVRHLDGDCGRAVDHVSIGQNVAVGTDDEAGAFAARRLRSCRAASVRRSGGRTRGTDRSVTCPAGR